MIPWWRWSTKAEKASAVVDALRHELLKARHQGEQLRLELALVKQARERSDAEAVYWRERAEKFIDQIAIRSGITAAPTMTAAPDTQADSHFNTVFAALGTSEISSHKSPSQSADRAAPVVMGVDPAVAQSAVADLLART